MITESEKQLLLKEQRIIQNGIETFVELKRQYPYGDKRYHYCEKRIHDLHDAMSDNIALMESGCD